MIAVARTGTLPPAFGSGSKEEDRPMRRFNTTGPCFPDEHYMVPAPGRLPGVRDLVACGDCFVIHAPRQTGKTIHVVGL